MDEILKIALENGMIDMSCIRERVELHKRNEILERHPYKIWQGKDGKWYTHIPDGGKAEGRRLVRRTTRKAVEDEAIACLREREENPTVREVFDEWNDRRLELKKISPATHTVNRQIFDRSYAEFGNRRIKALDAEDFAEFLEEQIPEHGLTAKAFANLKAVTGGLLRRARRRKLVDFSPDDVFGEMDTSDAEFRRPAKEDRDEVFSEQETALMLRHLVAHADIWNLGILLMFVTGIRVGELAALKWEDFEADAGAIRIRRTETHFKDAGGEPVYAVKDFPKTRAGWRTVAVPQPFQWVLGSLEDFRSDSEYVFTRNGERMTTNCFRRRLARTCDKLGIPKRSPHKIRKTYCTILFENGVDPKLITDQMGHTDISCSEVFYHRNRKELKEKIAVVSQIPDFRRGMMTVAK